MHRVVGGGGGWSCSGVVVASHRFQFAFFQIKSIFLFSYFSDKNGTSQLSLFGHSWKKKGTFGTQWQSLINSPSGTTSPRREGCCTRPRTALTTTGSTKSPFRTSSGVLVSFLLLIPIVNHR